MKKIFPKLLLSCLAGIMLSACQNDGNLPLQYPDEYGTIQFAVGTETPVVTRSYSDYTPSNHPTTMGVYGFASLGTISDAEFSTSDLRIFDNQQTTYADSKWSYTPLKYWADYSNATDFDFFAYMPYNAKASLTKAASRKEYTLSVPVTLSDPLVKEETALICNVPQHITAIEQKIPFALDQTLTGFSFSFKLGDKMSAIRHFEVKSVQLYGDGFPTNAQNTVSRTYTYSGSSWSAGAITWSTPATSTKAENEAFDIPYVNNKSNDDDTNYDNENHTMIVNNSGYRKWGATYYTIPGIVFTPTIKVVYDVVYEDESHHVVTRQGVPGRITLIHTNFPSYTSDKTGLPGHIYNVQIQIVPTYLYTMADADQASGVLKIE